MTRTLALLIALSAAASSAQAAGLDEKATRLIPYDDRFYSDAGLAVLHSRIGAAANQVCLDPTGPSPGATVNAACRAEAVRDARSQLDEFIARQLLERAAYPSPR
jgi:UrcA family protein